MNKRLNKDNLPDWWQGINTDDRLVLTNDIDSLFSCAILTKLFGCKIGGFFDFRQIAFCDRPKHLIGVDLDLKKGRCFSNHKTYFQNDKAINLNTLQPDSRYGRKYPLSTTLLILWLYEYPFHKLNDEQLKVLITIDSAYLWHWGNYDWNREVHAWWLKSMGLDIFTDLLNRIDKSDLEEIRKQYNLHKSIQLVNGKLETGIKIDEINTLFNGFTMELPTDHFKTTKRFKNIQLPTYMRKALADSKEICFSNAMVAKDVVKLSLLQQ